jgi:hypothetical protein
MNGNRKLAALVAAASFVLLGAARPAEAQGRGGNKIFGFYLNLGYTGIGSFPRWLTFGPELELRLGRALSINPEVSVWFRDSFGGSVYLVPGATVNFRSRHFFIGGGAIRRISEWEGQADGTLVPKVQAGFAQGPARLSGFLLYLDGTEALVFGINFGFRL